MKVNFKTKYSKEEAEHLFFTSDSHYEHSNILKYCNRPFKDVDEMNEKLIQYWNKTVSNDDIIFHLGDFSLCGSTKVKEILSQLNGTIVLIKGNHDYESTLKLFPQVFQQLSINIDKYKIYLNHFPFSSFPEEHYQLHGHLHSTENIGLKNQYDVGVDNNNYKPVSWKQIKEINKW